MPAATPKPRQLRKRPRDVTGAYYAPRDGLAFEPEFYPDNIHHPEWPQAVWGPDRPYAQTIVYRFSTVG